MRAPHLSPPIKIFVFPACVCFICLCYYVFTGRGDYMEILEIQRGGEMPKPRVVYSYPYEGMEVGDSFAVPKEARQKVANANYRASKRLGYKFVSKTEGEMLRVWRVA